MSRIWRGPSGKTRDVCLRLSRIDSNFIPPAPRHVPIQYKYSAFVYHLQALQAQANVRQVIPSSC